MDKDTLYLPSGAKRAHQLLHALFTTRSCRRSQKLKNRRALVGVNYRFRVVRNVRTNGPRLAHTVDIASCCVEGQSFEARFGGQSTGPNVSCYTICGVQAKARLTTHPVYVALSLCFRC